MRTTLVGRNPKCERLEGATPEPNTLLVSTVRLPVMQEYLHKTNLVLRVDTFSSQKNIIQNDVISKDCRSETGRCTADSEFLISNSMLKVYQGNISNESIREYPTCYISTAKSF